LASIRDFFSFRKRKKQQPTRLAAATAQAPDVPDFGGSRTTIPRFAMGGGGAGGNLPRRAQSELMLDEASLQSASLDSLIDILSDAHPDLGFALWNFLRIGNCDFKYKVMKVGSDKEDAASKKLIDQFLQMLELPNINRFESSRSLKKVINQLMLSVLTRGAGSLELVLASSLTGVAFLAPIDPATITFRFEQDRYVPYQDTDKISLDIPTFIYEALDDRIDDPYGRSPFTNAVQMILFQLQVLQDIKAVVHNQGYPRFDIKILEEVLLNRVPINIRNNEEKKATWLKAKLQEVIEMYNGLQPDDTFVHFDSIEMGTVGGGSGGGSLIDPEALMTVIDNQIMAGLKTLSTIMGRRSSGNTESFAKLEIKLYMAGVKAVQDVVSRIISRALTIMLNMNGKQGIVQFEFEPIEIRTELEQEQFNQIKLQNIAYKRDQGWIDQDMASIEAVGTPSVAEPNMEMLKGSAKTSEGGTPQGATRPSGG
jgi:hypothetical protein